MAGRQFRTKGLLENVSLIPIMIPEIILGMAYLTVFTIFQIPFGMVTMVIAHTTFCVPYIFILSLIHIFYRRWGIAPRPEDSYMIYVYDSTALSFCQQKPFPPFFNKTDVPIRSPSGKTGRI